MVKHEEVKSGVIFPIGKKNDAYAQYFVGQSYPAVTTAVNEEIIVNLICNCK